MLVDITLQKSSLSPILDIIAQIGGNSPEIIKHKTGIYEQGAFSFNHYICENVEKWPNLGKFDCYGVCDNYKQIINKYKVLKSKKRKFVIAITPILKSNQPPDGGWRWCKWGEYIGTQAQTADYLYNELAIEKVYVYHIYEIKE